MEPAAPQTDQTAAPESAPKHTPGWTSPEEEAAKTRAYEDALLHRYNNHLTLSRCDRAEARRIIKARAAIAKAEG